MPNHSESHRSVDQLKKNLNQTLLGKLDVVELVVACLLARGYLLFDDLPGLGKTTLAKALAQSMGGKLARSCWGSRPAMRSYVRVGSVTASNSSSVDGSKISRYCASS